MHWVRGCKTPTTNHMLRCHLAWALLLLLGCAAAQTPTPVTLTTKASKPKNSRCSAALLSVCACYASHGGYVRVLCSTFTVRMGYGYYAQCFVFVLCCDLPQLLQQRLSLSNILHDTILSPTETNTKKNSGMGACSRLNVSSENRRVARSTIVQYPPSLSSFWR